MLTRSLVRRIGTFSLGLGLDPRKLLAAVRAVPHYISAALEFRRQMRLGGQAANFRLVPTLSDLYASSGVAQGHYFHQDLWAAREIFKRNPARHFDVGSRVDGFIAHLLCFRDVEVFDIRLLTSKVAGLHFRQANLMSAKGLDVNAADSVSCLHALEHFGLGRYGDPVDVDGWKKGLVNLTSMIKPTGILYLSVPVGKSTVEFNAHRIFAATEVVAEAGSAGLDLQSFSFIDDSGDFRPDAAIAATDGLEFGCGCFLFIKR